MISLHRFFKSWQIFEKKILSIILNLSINVSYVSNCGYLLKYGFFYGTLEVWYPFFVVVVVVVVIVVDKWYGSYYDLNSLCVDIGSVPGSDP